MPTLPQSRFIRAALRSGQVTQAQIDHASDQLRQEGGPAALPAVEAGDRLLAEQLVRDRVLTAYQADQLQQGRTKLNLGPYVITDWLGQGGMGQVFAAVHQLMGRTVAIKVLPQHKSTPDAIASFTREIQTQARLDHRNLVRAYDAGHEGKVYFLVTEFVPGTDLRRLLRRRGRLTMYQAASVIAQAAHGLQHAHQRGLVHRDVKPGNILVTPEGHVKVSDLGLAGFLHDDDDPRAGKIVGTADYLAPEVIRNPENKLPVSDIYALGCTLYYAVTGKVPFPGGSTREKARRHCEETPWHPRQFNADINDEFVDLIADMMEKDPARRIQTAAEVTLRLAPWTERRVALSFDSTPQSPWTGPPIPADPETDETRDDFADIGSGPGEDNGARPTTTTQATVAQGDSSQDTFRTAPPPPGNETASRQPYAWWVILMAAILGAALGSLLTLLAI